MTIEHINVVQNRPQTYHLRICVHVETAVESMTSPFLLRDGVLKARLHIYVAQDTLRLWNPSMAL